MTKRDACYLVPTWYNIANANPIRYRGYYYDNDLGLYYLQSRYYDSHTDRFINADGYITTGQGVLSYNMFAYCGNNPINRVDPTGHFWRILIGVAVAVFTTVALSGCSRESSGNNSTENDSSTTSSTEPPYIPSQEELVYAATVYAESGGQNKRTKQAVAHSMYNRIGTTSSRTDIVAVLSEDYQYDGYDSVRYHNAMNYYRNGICDNPLERAAMEESLAVVIPIYSGDEVDFTGGVTYFHSLATPEEWEYHKYYTQVYISGTEAMWFYK